MVNTRARSRARGLDARARARPPSAFASPGAVTEFRRERSCAGSRRTRRARVLGRTCACGNTPRCTTGWRRATVPCDTPRCPSPSPAPTHPPSSALDSHTTGQWSGLCGRAQCVYVYGASPGRQGVRSLELVYVSFCACKAAWREVRGVLALRGHIIAVLRRQPARTAARRETASSLAGIRECQGRKHGVHAAGGRMLQMDAFPTHAAGARALLCSKPACRDLIDDNGADVGGVGCRGPQQEAAWVSGGWRTATASSVQSTCR